MCEGDAGPDCLTEAVPALLGGPVPRLGIGGGSVAVGVVEVDAICPRGAGVFLLRLGSMNPSLLPVKLKSADVREAETG